MIKMIGPAAKLLKEAAAKWRRDRAELLAASLAYYSVFSLAPLLMLAVAVSSLRAGAAESRRFMIDFVSGFVGPRGAEAVRPMIESAGSVEHGAWATVISLATLAFGASSLFLHLQDALNIIWQAPQSSPRRFRRFLKRRVLSFALVLLVPLLVLLAPMFSAALARLGHSPSSSILVSLIVESVVFAFIFKILPDVIVPWQDVWVGALFTAALFTVGQTILAFYLNHVASRSVYGAAGSLVALLIWVHASAQMLLFGAEFIQVYKPPHTDTPAKV